MKELTIIMLALALEQPPTLVILTPEGETTTPQEVEHIEASYASATAWWGMEKQAIQVEVAAAPSDALSSPPVYPEGTVVVIDNSKSGALLLGSYRGIASPGRIWVVSGAFHLPAVFAHEIGHAEYGLEHWGDCIGLDIMCSPDAAYQAHSIGCRSLEALGRPCSKTYIPEVSR